MSWILLIFIQHAHGMTATHTTFPTATRCEAARIYVLQDMPRPAGATAISALCVASGETA